MMLVQDLEIVGSKAVQAIDLPLLMFDDFRFEGVRHSNGVVSKGYKYRYYKNPLFKVSFKFEEQGPPNT